MLAKLLHCFLFNFSQSSLLFKVFSYDAFKHCEDLKDIDAVILDKSINSVFLCVHLYTCCLFLGRVLNSLFGKQLFCFMFMHFLVRGDDDLWQTPFNSGDKECWCIGEEATSWMWLLLTAAHLPVAPCSF